MLKKNVKNEMPEGSGDVWTWAALDADTKLMVSWFVGDRDVESANYFMHDVAARLANRVQLTTDGHYAYLSAIDNAFHLDIDYAMLVKMYGAPEGKTQTERKYSPNECTGEKKQIISGEPNKKFISTSCVKRSNLSIRMGNRRFTRLSNAFSKKNRKSFSFTCFIFCLL
jgi:IS1 family transposase